MAYEPLNLPYRVPDDNGFPIKTCTKCNNVLIYTYTCQPRYENTRDFGSQVQNGFQVICRACRSIQKLEMNETVCCRDQVARVLKTRTANLNNVLPENPRPRRFGEAGKITVEALRPLMNRPGTEVGVPQQHVPQRYSTQPYMDNGSQDFRPGAFRNQA